MAKFIRFALVLAASVSSCSALAEPTALVVIDMQPFFIERLGHAQRPGNPEKVEDVLARQRQLIQAARAPGMPIVLVESPDMSATRPDLAAAVAGYGEALYVVKSENDAFAGAPGRFLTRFLDARAVRKLVVVGAIGGSCVARSVRSALELGYHVESDPRATADFNYRKFVHPFRFDAPDLVDRVGRTKMLDRADAAGRVPMVDGLGATPPMTPAALDATTCAFDLGQAVEAPEAPWRRILNRLSPRSEGP